MAIVIVWVWVTKAGILDCVRVTSDDKLDVKGILVAVDADVADAIAAGTKVNKTRTLLVLYVLPLVLSCSMK